MKLKFDYASIKIVNTYWVGNVGFILAENNKTKKQSCLIGACKGNDEQEDIRNIMDWGQPLFLKQAQGFFHEKIRPDDYTISSDGLEDWFENEHK